MNEFFQMLKKDHVSELVLKKLEKMPKDEEKWGAKVCLLKELVARLDPWLTYWESEAKVGGGKEFVEHP